MPKAEQDRIAKTARMTPYQSIGLQAANAATSEATEGLAVVEPDSAYNSNTDNSSQDSIEFDFTHPRCYDNDHVEKLETFTQDLDQALKKSFPLKAQANRYPYTGVFVLLLRWMDDDLQVQREITKLNDVFADQFSFEVEQWQIPSTKPTRALQNKLYDFQNSHQIEEELLIVYYGGHGDADRRRGRSLWRANNRPDSPSLNWSSLQHLFETAVPCVLIILDCCFAANAARDTAEGTTKEILAACGRENPTLGVCERSFSSALVEELQAFGGTPFTVAMLHSRLVTMRWRLAFTPIYALLSENGGSSIAISPLPRFQSPLAANMGWSNQSSTNPSPAIELEGNYINGQNILSSASQCDRNETRVLLSVSIAQEAELDLASWTAWLSTTVPWDVLKMDVQLESVFRSHSTLVLISIPISGWNLLAERPAYKYVGFIRSRNLMAQVERDKQTQRQRPSKRPEMSRQEHSLLGDAATTMPEMEGAVSDGKHEFLHSRGTRDADSEEWSTDEDELLQGSYRQSQQSLNWQPISNLDSTYASNSSEQQGPISISRCEGSKSPRDHSFTDSAIGTDTVTQVSRPPITTLPPIVPLPQPLAERPPARALPSIEQLPQLLAERPPATALPPIEQLLQPLFERDNMFGWFQRPQ